MLQKETLYIRNGIRHANTVFIENDLFLQDSVAQTVSCIFIGTI